MHFFENCQNILHFFENYNFLSVRLQFPYKNRFAVDIPARLWYNFYIKKRRLAAWKGMKLSWRQFRIKPRKFISLTSQIARQNRGFSALLPALSVWALRCSVSPTRRSGTSFAYGLRSSPLRLIPSELRSPDFLRSIPSTPRASITSCASLTPWKKKPATSGLMLLK